MRFLIIPLLLLTAGPALAQVTVNPNALNSLSTGEPNHATTTHHAAPHRVYHPPPRRPVEHHVEAHHAPTKPAPEQHPAPAAAAPAPGTTHPTQAGPPPPFVPPPQAPAIPTTPPAAAVLPPVVVVPHPLPPPPPVPVTATAPGTATKLSDGVRVTFGADRADLNPGTEFALQDFAKVVKDQPVAINVMATAAGTQDDPSTPRRLSLSRALAVRAVLINEGIPSPRILRPRHGGRCRPGTGGPG